MEFVPPLIKKFPSIPGLDSLRFFAFLAVFISHSIYFLGLFKNTTVGFLIPYLTIGDLGVSAFFILSGFLITSLLITEKESYGSISLRNFYIKRSLRIWPLYFLIIVLGCIVIPHLVTTQLFPNGYTLTGTGPLWKLITFTFNLGQSPDFQGISLVLAVLWSLSVEEQFYIVWPWIVNYLSTRKLLLASIGIIVIAVLSRVLYVNDLSFIEYNTLSVMGDIALGNLLSFCYFYYPSLFTTRLCKVAYPLLFLGAIIVLSVIGLRPTMKTYAWFRVIEPLLFGAGIIIIITSIIASLKILTHPVTVFLGKISYGLYMYHVLAMILILSISKYLIPLSVNIIVIGSCITTIGIATLSYYGIEKRFLNLKKGFTR